MQIEAPRYTERFGAVRINDVQKVLQLDSGGIDTPSTENIAALTISDPVTRDIEKKMAIVLPDRDEKLKLFEGVISGIPHNCLIIVISNSQRNPVDRFRMEKDTLEQFCYFTRRQALILHQKDPRLADGLERSGYACLLGEDGMVRDGKAEGMAVGTLIAMLANKDYVGFIDVDNYFPGAVWEYVKCYAAGFALARSPYAMIRVLWRYKPKMMRGLYFKKWGRVSEITNAFFNSLMSSKTGFETEIIRTGNAGEHALSIKLAEILPLGSGFAAEPQELVSIFEGFGGILPTREKAAADSGVEVFQIETRNPHLHEDKGREHLRRMMLSSLATIYHSKLSDPGTKRLISEELKRNNALGPKQRPQKPCINMPLNKADLRVLAGAMSEHLNLPEGLGYVE